MEKFWLSKSTFIRSIKCQKALYLNKYKKNLRDEISEAQQAIFDQGTEAGQLAQDLFPGGKDASPENYWDFSESLFKTEKWIKEGVGSIYEAAFQYEGVLAALDIFVQKNGKYYAYEVKSSTSMKEVYLQDAALQYYVMKMSGYEPEEIFVVYINNQYKRGKKLELEQLFTIESVQEEVLALQPKIPKWIKKAKKTLNRKTVPDIKIGKQCTKPYDCDFMSHCWQHIPEDSVFDLRYGRSKKWSLYNQGIVLMKDIPDDFKLSKTQTMQVRGIKENYTYQDDKKIKKFLKSWKYPLYFLDFETFSFAVPPYPQSRPYQQLPFQYSLHVLGEPGGKLHHTEFLADPDSKDPRIPFVKQLIRDVKDKGSIIVFNQHFEEGRLEDITEDFPEYKEDLEAINARMIDLMLPFQKQWYYEPKLNGSYSIKKVLPALVPGVSYDNLDISKGDQASRAYSARVQGHNVGDWKETQKHLLAYCELDTLAMVKIWQALKEKVGV